MKKIYFLSFFIIVVLTSCQQIQIENKSSGIIPSPLQYEAGSGYFKIDQDTKIILESETDFSNEAGFLQDLLKRTTGYPMEISTDLDTRNTILLEQTENADLGNEGYELEVNKHGITIKALTGAGIFYGIQSLLQMLPPAVFGDGIEKSIWEVPQCRFYDKPRFTWRGMHLDVSRHFFPVSFVKKYIDLIAMHKMNKFHWHLTDDNGWRIEIKHYPQLTEVAAWHVDRTDEPWREMAPPRPGEKATVGGFYTQDEIREVLAYAAGRHVEVIPEIEMPGHSSEVFAAYPEFSCTGKKLYVQPGSYWPNIDIFCAGKEETFTFIENVLTEVMDLFPSEYIHIGGDEATKDRWKACPLCQQRIIDEGLADENELQSWFIHRIEKFVNAHGKKMIGWDEILEGGLAPEATVMSWRGFQGGINAATQGHDVIMCPTSHCYFDYYQADPEFEPEAIGGLTTLKKVYSFEPIPFELNKEQAKFILGAQGNLWTEFIPTAEKAEYMVLPRMTAMAEAVWSPVEKRDWNDFLVRLQDQFKRFDQLKVNYSTGSWKVSIRPILENGVYQVALETERLNPEIHYTLDGSTPTSASMRYKSPLIIDSTTAVKTGIFVDGKLKEKISGKTIVFHKVAGMLGNLRTPANPKYSADGPISLTDGILGSEDFRDGYWLGFQGDDLDFTINLLKPMEINKIEIPFLQNIGSWILPPKEVQIDVLDANHDVLVTVVLTPEMNPDLSGTLIENAKATFEKIEGSAIHVKAVNYGMLPKWHEYAGEKSWIFADEIIVE